jgi:hypothetical protein
MLMQWQSNLDKGDIERQRREADQYNDDMNAPVNSGGELTPEMTDYLNQQYPDVESMEPYIAELAGKYQFETPLEPQEQQHILEQEARARDGLPEEPYNYDGGTSEDDLTTIGPADPPNQPPGFSDEDAQRGKDTWNSLSDADKTTVMAETFGIKPEDVDLSGYEFDYFNAMGEDVDEIDYREKALGIMDNLQGSNPEKAFYDKADPGGELKSNMQDFMKKQPKPKKKGESLIERVSEAEDCGCKNTFEKAIQTLEKD